ncbi:CrcB family protein [Schaalia sp. ZJ1691]|uniref:fluoride efflux transporter FluC n=1 Tax=Schaalia sp. ZJ1691 TaxID=2709404 RepID=UPI0013E9EA90|nr:CrcB family protein [Schaalia sp. ZJ1691]
MLSSSNAHRIPIGIVNLPPWAYVAVGGGLGTLLRAILDEAARHTAWNTHTFVTWSTIAVNLAGAFFLGAVSARLAQSSDAAASDAFAPAPPASTSTSTSEGEQAGPSSSIEQLSASPSSPPSSATHERLRLLLTTGFAGGLTTYGTMILAATSHLDTTTYLHSFILVFTGVACAGLGFALASRGGQQQS